MGKCSERAQTLFDPPAPFVPAAEAEAVRIVAGGGKNIAGGEANPKVQRRIEEGARVNSTR